jgi:REP element-mobilizing transposase RayT
MSLHSYSKCWLHLIWGTLNREKFLNTAAIRKEVSSYLYQYAASKDIYVKKIYVNAEHVHALIDLPTNMAIEEVMHLLKGNSSHWINENNISSGKFSWGRGYAAFSVSESVLNKVTDYIEKQEEHHRIKTFTEEYDEFIRMYGMKFINE